MASHGDITVQDFIAKWRHTELSERAASQEHFIDLCHLLGQPTPAEHDKSGSEYTFEKSVSVTAPASKGSAGAGGFADVWWRGKFGWEYKRKGKHKDLADAYRQLCQYREALDNPPLLIVCDIARTEIHTNFTGTAKQVHAVELAELDQPEKLDLLRRVFTDPESFRPDITREQVTNDVAARIASIAQALRDRGHDPHLAAHFLMKCMFCLFAEDIQLLPAGIFTKLLGKLADAPEKLCEQMDQLFAAMKDGGMFLLEDIEYFNGGLFATGDALQLEPPEIAALLEAARQDWSAVEPAIFGTLFERSLDPSKRAQIGAHYTSREDILLIVEPVIMAPLRKQWQAVQHEIDAQLARRAKATTDATKRKANDEIANLLRDFLDRLSQLRILDPACGSGNFLYVAIQELLFLEKEVIRFAAGPDIQQPLFPTVRPTQLHGIEVNPYAAELAQVVIWIGYLQWMRDNGFNVPRDPILEPLRTIENRDAILAWQHDGQPIATWQSGATCLGPATWPRADFIIGNPPFLGSKLFRANGLPDDYIQAMYDTYDIPNTSDLCCYWFEKARQIVEASVRTRNASREKEPAGKQVARPTVRAGLLATQGIRGGANRKVLERIKDTGDIFMAHADREWILDGAAVHVSMVGFDDGTEDTKILDGKPTEQINTDLTAEADLTSAKILPWLHDLVFMGDTKGGAFDLPWDATRPLLGSPNPNGESNALVLRPWINGSDITRRNRGMWIIDFGCEMGCEEAAGFEKPYEHILQHVEPKRRDNKRASYAKYWWRHVEPRPDLRLALQPLSRFPVTCRVSKFRLFQWFTGMTLPDSATFAFARDDDYFFGVLHSSVHELWALRQGTQLEDRPRYTPTTCFETFALPWRPGEEDFDDPLVKAIGEAAAELNAQRERWLNPPEWIEPIAAAVDAEDDFADVAAVCGDETRALIRESAIMAAAAKDKNLKKRTLTNLYNERPTWLKLAHRKLDEAVLAAYAAVDPEGDWDPAWAEVWEPTGAGQPLPEDHELAPRRADVDQVVLANLLRLNLAQ